MNETKPKVSVIICTYSMERFADVLEAIDSALTQTLSPHQVIVSIDHNQELLEKLNSEIPSTVTLVFNGDAKGISETRNTGVRAATGDIIAFMDDDAVAEKDWLEKLVQHFKTHAVAAAGGKIVPRWLDGSRPEWFPEEMDWIVGCTYAGLPQRGNRVRNLIGCNMAFRAGIFDSVGFFNPAVGRTSKTHGIGEEPEFCLRLAHVIPGALIVYEPRAVVHHKVPSWRSKMGYVLQRSYDEGYHKNQIRRLHPGSAVGILATESSYLRHLFLTAIPRRLRQLYRWEAFLQLAVILTSVAATGAGYLRGQMRWEKQN